MILGWRQNRWHQSPRTDCCHPKRLEHHLSQNSTLCNHMDERVSSKLLLVYLWTALGLNGIVKKTSFASSHAGVYPTDATSNNHHFSVCLRLNNSLLRFPFCHTHTSTRIPWTVVYIDTQSFFSPSLFSLYLFDALRNRGSEHTSTRTKEVWMFKRNYRRWAWSIRVAQ